MKIIKDANTRRQNVPETWDEAYGMLVDAMKPAFQRNGAQRNNVASRVALGMYGEEFNSRSGVDCLLYLMQKIAKQSGSL